MKACEMMCLRTVEGVTRLDRVSNRKVRKAQSSDRHDKGEAKKEEDKIGAKE